MHKKTGKNKGSGENVLADGVFLLTGEMREEESRLLTLLLKGFLIYLIVMGGIGCFLTSLNIQCTYWIIHIGVFLGAVFSSSLYYNRKWQNIGYVLLLFAMLFTAVWLRGYISSGVFAVANELSKRASVFFGSSAVKTYAEQISRRNVTIPVAMCYVGWVAAIVVNVMISRRMRYMAAGFLCVAVLFTPLYLEREPSSLYLLMLTGGLLATYIFRKNGHYQLSWKNRRYLCEAGKHRITYIYAGKVMGSMVAAVLMISVVLICLFGLFLPEERYANMRSASGLKEGTMDVMENFTLLGLTGLFNYYPNTGGLSGGTLGGVSAVRLDYETDLTAVYVPHDLNRFYLKSFTGSEYMPVQNKWKPSLQREEGETWEKYQKMYERREKKSARGQIRITNVAAPDDEYLPYYSPDTDKKAAPGVAVGYEYYMYHGNLDDYEKDSFNSLEIFHDSLEYFQVPEANREALDRFCGEAGLKKGESLDAAAKKVRDYFQKNIPYTTRPGATPYQKDFVNYFLTENRKGYCAHYASAAALIFRQLGYMTRYVEGYVIDPADISADGQVMDGEKQDDYYSGYMPLDETAVVSVDITDAGAHAWIEVYDWSCGWRVVDVTPVSMERNDAGNGILQQFFDFLLSDAGDGDIQAGGSGQDISAPDPGNGMFASFGRSAGILFLAAVLFVLFVLLVRMVVRRMIWYQRYLNAGYSDRLIMSYQRFIRRKIRRDRELGDGLNYREQVQRLILRGVWKPEEEERERIVSLLEQAGFSDKPITSGELDWMKGWFKYRV
jgi:Transglutaminase-like enzymes, putative cysteine proteases